MIQKTHPPLTGAGSLWGRAPIGTFVKLSNEATDSDEKIADG